MHDVILNFVTDYWSLDDASYVSLLFLIPLCRDASISTFTDCAEGAMEDDIVAALTHEVKEEIIESYFYERRLIEEQFKYVNELAVGVIELEENLYKRFARIYVLLQEPQYVEAFIKLIRCNKAPLAVGLKGKRITNEGYGS